MVFTLNFSMLSSSLSLLKIFEVLLIGWDFLPNLIECLELVIRLEMIDPLDQTSIFFVDFALHCYRMIYDLPW